jgi:diaminopimelate decarboxylase
MNHFEYRNGVLFAEDVPLADIARHTGTPFYCYSSATLERHYRVFAEAFTGTDHLICYAVKANSNQAVIATLARLNAGADVVSAGELVRALRAGIAPERIVFSGVGKTDVEMAAALKAGIYQFNVESEPELRLLSQMAQASGLRAPLALRINPDVDAKSHAKISTGKSENKFGLPWPDAERLYDLAASLPGVDPLGIDVHIGSQITELTPFENAFRRIADLVHRLRVRGHKITRLDLGGGLGIPYRAEDDPPHPEVYAKMVREVAADLGCRLIFEPGRLLVGNAGLLVAKVLYVKKGLGRDFLILDAGMNDLIRPALYDAHHGILPLSAAGPDAALQPFDVVGPVCETGDLFASRRLLPPLAAGELIAFETAGAYGASQGSTYNSRPLIAEVLVRGGDWALIRPRQTLDELIGQDRLAPWLA